MQIPVRDRGTGKFPITNYLATIPAHKHPIPTGFPVAIKHLRLALLVDSTVIAVRKSLEEPFVLVDTATYEGMRDLNA